MKPLPNKCQLLVPSHLLFVLGPSFVVSLQGGKAGFNFVTLPSANVVLQQSGAAKGDQWGLLGARAGQQG